MAEKAHLGAEVIREPEHSSSADHYDDHLTSLKALTEKLKLETRRPSYLEWKAQFEMQNERIFKTQEKAQEEPEAAAGATRQPTRTLLNSIVNHDGGLLSRSPKEFENIDEALGWLRKELTEMRVQDQQLARQLMRLRSDINQLKIDQTCRLHRTMLNDATFELEERDELSDLLCDLPMTPGFGLSTPLRLIGVTKMNINSRRFSLC